MFAHFASPQYGVISCRKKSLHTLQTTNKIFVIFDYDARAFHAPLMRSWKVIVAYNQEGSRTGAIQ